MPNFTFTTGRPAGNLTPAQQRTTLTTNNDSINSIVGGNASVDMIGFNDNDGGWHRKVTYVVQGAAPGSAAGQLVEYSKTSSGSSELFLQRDGVATEIQLTRGGVSVAANGYTFLPGGLLLQWGSVVASPGGTVFNFPTAFTSAVYSVTLGMRAGGAQASAVGVPGLNSVTVFSASGAQTVYVMAIGV